jgi:hypothetical protein
MTRRIDELVARDGDSHRNPANKAIAPARLLRRLCRRPGIAR